MSLEMQLHVEHNYFKSFKKFGQVRSNGLSVARTNHFSAYFVWSDNKAETYFVSLKL